jgi:signal transduction histidine kinase
VAVVSRLRWAIILVATAFVVVVEGLSDTLLDGVVPFPLDTAIVGLIVLGAGIVTSAVAFRVVERLERELRERNARLEAREATTRTLHAMTVAITALAELTDVLAATTRNARALLGADAAWLVLSTPEGGDRLAATSGPDGAFDPLGGFPFPASDARRFVRPDLVAVHLAAPLQRRGTTIGSLAIGTAARRTYDVDDLETLSSLANQAAIAIENDRLQRELRGLAISAERERIAREMHDGLAQVLGYVNAKSQAVEALLADGRVDDARTQMTELASAARSMYVDVREAIMGLSTPLGEGSLSGALDAYAHRFSEASKLAVAVESASPHLGDDLRPEVVANVMRIVQEALTNVRKHAAAQRVVIHLAGQPDGLAITVEDDGRGFDPSSEPGPADWPHFGRETIRQRAAAIGASASWDSAPGRGTRLRVVVPVGSMAAS